jgi:hypothetical protein
MKGNCPSSSPIEEVSMDANAVYTLVSQIIPKVPATVLMEISTIISAALGDDVSLKTQPDGLWSDAGCVLLGHVQAKKG